MSTVERIQILITDQGGSTVVRRLQDIGRAAVGAQKNADLLNRAFAGLAGILSAREIIRMVDTYTNMQNKLKLVTTDTANLSRVTKELFAVSQSTRTSMDATALLYTRMASATKGLGLEQSTLISFVKGVNQAVILSGASTVEATNAIRQFTQGLAKGRLDGDELRSVLEQLPFVADVIAKSLGVARGELRELGKQGKLTPQIILTAFREMEGELSTLFEKTLPTFSQAWQVFTDRMMMFFGEMATDAGLQNVFAQTLALIADNMDLIISAILTALPLLGALATYWVAMKTVAILIPIFTTFAGALIGVTAAVGGAIIAFGQMDHQVDDTITRLGLQVSAVDKLVATWAAARAYIQVAWDSFPEWFGNLMQTAMDKALTQFARVADFLPDFLRKTGDQFGKFMEKNGMNGNVPRNMMADLAGQLKGGDDIRAGIAAGAAQRPADYESALDRANRAASNAYNSTLLARARPIGELTANPGGGGRTPAGDVDKNAAKKVPSFKFNDAVKELQEQIELLGLETRERERLSEVLKYEDKIRDSIQDKKARAAWGGLSEGDKQQLENMILLTQRLEEQNKIYDEIRAPQQEFYSSTTALLALFQDGKITLEEYNNKMLGLQLGLLQTDRTIQGGLMHGVLTLQDEMTNLGSVASDAIVNGFKGAEDQLLSFVTTGKANVTDMVNSILSDLARLAIRQSITGPLASALAGAMGGFLGPSISGVSPGAFSSQMAGSFDGMSPIKFAHGGDWTVGGVGGIDSQQIAFKATPGETISVRKPGEVNNGGGGVTMLSPKFTIVDNVGVKASVSQSQDEQGNPDWTIVLDQMSTQMAEEIRRGESPVSSAMADRFGLEEKPRGR